LTALLVLRTALLLLALALRPLCLAIGLVGRAGRLHLRHSLRGCDNTNPRETDHGGADNRNKTFHFRFRSIFTAHVAGVQD
jgi:hypothetical protein